MTRAHSTKTRLAIGLVVCLLFVHAGARATGEYVDGVFSGQAAAVAVTAADVVHQIQSPDRFSHGLRYSHGLTWDGASLWLCGAFSSMIYQLDPANGMVLTSYNSGIGSLRGLTFGDGHLWVSSFRTEKIYKLVPSTGMVVDSFPAPFPGKPNGMAWDDGVLWVSQADGLIHRVNAANGMLIS
jgi:outer membrane protein assembly factor BamB